MIFGKQIHYCANCGKRQFDDRLGFSVLPAMCSKECRDEFQLKYTRKILHKDAEDIIPTPTDPKFFEGWCACLDSVRASLEDYPNAGGDVVIMHHVDRLRREVAVECAALADECENDDMTAGAVWEAIKKRFGL